MEVIIYIGLFSIIIGGGVAASYSVMESAGRNQTKTMVLQEGNFLLGKIRWELSESEVIDLPPFPPDDTTPTTASALELTTRGAVVIHIELRGDDIHILYPSTSSILNNNNVQVSGLTFSRQRDSTDEEILEIVHAEFTLTAKTPNGQTVSESFRSDYSRK